MGIFHNLAIAYIPSVAAYATPNFCSCKSLVIPTPPVGEGLREYGEFALSRCTFRLSSSNDRGPQRRSSRRSGAAGKEAICVKASSVWSCLTYTACRYVVRIEGVSRCRRPLPLICECSRSSRFRVLRLTLGHSPTVPQGWPPRDPYDRCTRQARTAAMPWSRAASPGCEQSQRPAALPNKGGALLLVDRSLRQTPPLRAGPRFSRRLALGRQRMHGTPVNFLTLFRLLLPGRLKSGKEI